MKSCTRENNAEIIQVAYLRHDSSFVSLSVNCMRCIIIALANMINIAVSR